MSDEAAREVWAMANSPSGDRPAFVGEDGGGCTRQEVPFDVQRPKLAGLEWLVEDTKTIAFFGFAPGVVKAMRLPGSPARRSRKRRRSVACGSSALCA